MNDDDDTECSNIAETLARVLPQAHIALDAAPGSDRVLHVAVPKGQTLQTIDLEPLLPRPRRAKLGGLGLRCLT